MNAENDFSKMINNSFTLIKMEPRREETNIPEDLQRKSDRTERHGDQSKQTTLSSRRCSADGIAGFVHGKCRAFFAAREIRPWAPGPQENLLLPF